MCVCSPGLPIKSDSCATLHIGLKLEASIGLPLWQRHCSDESVDPGKATRKLMYITCFNQNYLMFTSFESLMWEMEEAWFRCLSLDSCFFWGAFLPHFLFRSSGCIDAPSDGNGTSIAADIVDQFIWDWNFSFSLSPVLTVVSLERWPLCQPVS